MKAALLTATEYVEILLSYLVPMFPGSELEPSPVPNERDEMVAPDEARSLLVKPDRAWPYCFRLRRRHPFESDDVKIAKQFIRALREKLVASEQPFFRYLIDTCPQDVVAWSVQHKAVSDDLLPSIIALLRKWASETYEGSRISVCIGVDSSPVASQISNVHLSTISNKDFTKVLSNGMDTLLVLSPSGHVVDHLALNQIAPPSSSSSEPSFSPYRYLPLAQWSSRTRVVFSLNRHGEILVFKSGRLQFAFRRGTWSHFAHAAMIARMGGTPKERSLMRAVYASCLDISFSRTGGCIAVAIGSGAHKPTEFLNPSDLLKVGTTEKTTLLRHLIGQPFDKLPRPIREEMAALDGATVLDRAGVVLAVGAIVRVPGGSDGGGRRAAAKSLSRLGLAVKVSADGGITAFTDRGSKHSPEVAFEVCV